MRSARIFMAPSVLPNDSFRDGNAHVLASGIVPKPLALLPFAELTIQFTSRIVTLSLTIPPNLIGTR
jgi:hypothetical protein